MIRATTWGTKKKKMMTNNLKKTNMAMTTMKTRMRNMEAKKMKVLIKKKKMMKRMIKMMKRDKTKNLMNSTSKSTSKTLFL